MNLGDGVVDADWKAAEFALAYGEVFVLDLDLEPPLEHDETLVALLVHVQTLVTPGCVGVVIPDLQFLRAKTDLIRRHSTHEEG